MTCTRCNGDGCLDNGEGVTVECIRCHGSGRCVNATLVSDFYTRQSDILRESGPVHHAMQSALTRMGCVGRSLR